ELPTIDSLSLGGAASASGSASVALAGAGAGANTTNTLANKVKAYLTGGAAVTAQGGSVRLSATDNAANVNARAIAGSFSGPAAPPAAVAVAVGAGLANNNIGDMVLAYCDGSDIIASSGDVSIKANATPTVHATSTAGAVSLGFAPAGIAFSGAGANSTDTIH